MKEERTTTEARQAVTGHGVHQVLAWSLGGAALAMIAVLLVYFA